MVQEDDRPPIGERFQPFNQFLGSMVPEWLERRWELKALTKLVYARLTRYAGRDGDAFPSMEKLGDDLGMAPETVRTHVRALREHGLIAVEQRGLGRSNRYYFLTHPWNVDWLGRQSPASKPVRPGGLERVDRPETPALLREEPHDIRESEPRDSS